MPCCSTKLDSDQPAILEGGEADALGKGVGIIRPMLLRAGLVSFALLLASRLLGLLRESVQAATLGAGAAADVAILMLTLPDLLSGVLAAGGLAYVLLPLWARQTPAGQAASQRRVAQALLAVGTAAALAVLLLPGLAGRSLAPGLSGAADPSLAHAALGWSALCLPLALLAALWNTRLQHQRDVLGAYGASLWVNGLVVLALWGAGHWPTVWVETLGSGMLLGMLARLLWLRWRLQRGAVPTDTSAPALRRTPAAHDSVPPAPVWLWALASAGLPLLLPLVARSLASAEGEGALTRFHYGWKLVELPLVLAVQLVAMLSLPRLARAWADPAADTRGARTDALRHAFVLAWVLACAAAAALAGLAPALAQLLFGWGRMPPDAVAQVAHSARIGAWSLLPQALLAVLMTLLASTGRLRQAVAAYALALLVLVLVLGMAWAARWALPGGAGVMVALNAALLAAALWLLRSEHQRALPALCARDLLPAALAAVAAAAVGARWGLEDRWAGLLQALLLAGSVLGVAWLASPGWRAALRR